MKKKKQNKNKTVLFITHHNNDFDHFLPLMVKLKKEEMSVKVIAFFTKWDILKNKLHNYICEDNQIFLDEMADVGYLSVFNKMINRIYRYTLKKYPLSEGLNLLFVKYFVLQSIFLVPDKKICDYLKRNNINLVVMDHRIIDESAINKGKIMTTIDILRRKTSHMNYILFRCCSLARKEKIPIFMMPHGVQPICKSMRHKLYDNIKNPFRPDYLVSCSKNDAVFDKHFYSYF